MKYLVFVLMMIISSSSYAETAVDAVNRLHAIDGVPLIKNPTMAPTKKNYYFSVTIESFMTLDEGKVAGLVSFPINYDPSNIDDLKVMMDKNSRFQKTNIKELKPAILIFDNEKGNYSNISTGTEYFVIGNHYIVTEDKKLGSIPTFYVFYIAKTKNQPGSYERAINDGAKGILNIFGAAEDAVRVFGGSPR